MLLETFTFTKNTYRAKMWQELVYVIHVYAVIFLKSVLVHPEREKP